MTTETNAVERVADRVDQGHLSPARLRQPEKRHVSGHAPAVVQHEQRARQRAALVAQRRLSEGKGDKSFYEAKIKTARFYADHLLTQAPALRNTIVRGASGVMALAEEQF